MRHDRVIAFGNARLGSSRCPQKMIRPFAGTTLTHIALRRLERLHDFDGVYFAAHEPQLIDIADQYPRVTLIRRSRESATVCNPITTVHDYLRDLDFDYAFWINSCHALLSAETVEAALARFQGDPSIKSLTAVVRSHDWYFTMDGTAVNNTDPSCVDTKKTPPLYAVCHAFHCFSKQHFFQSQSYWTNRPNDPHLYEIDPIEALDVDTELDFELAQCAYKRHAGQPRTVCAAV